MVTCIDLRPWREQARDDGQRWVIVVRHPKEPETLDEATLIALAGISHRNLTRWRQQGLIQPIEPRHGRGQARGTTQLRYPKLEVCKINRLNELRREFKKVAEWRWRLWLEGYSVRIAPDLADTLDQLIARAPKVRTVGDVETMISAGLWKPIDVPRGNPLRVILRDLSRKDLRSLTTMVICLLLGIRLPLLDEANPSPFRIFKRTFGLPEEWELPPGLFDFFPLMHEQIANGLRKATADELEEAKAACQFLSRYLDHPEPGDTAASNSLQSHLPVKFASFMWPSPVVRAGTVGLIILAIRGLRVFFDEVALPRLVARSSQG